MPQLPRFKASLILLLVLEASCERRQVSVPVPAPPSAASQPAPQTSAPAASAAPSSSGASTESQESNAYQVNKPPQAKKKAARSAPATPATPADPVAAGPATPTPAPKLGDVLTADQQKRFNASVDQSLAHAQASLESVERRQLNKDQQAEVEQVRSFIQQAQGARSSDLAGAKSLAERAEVLARDLAASVH
jgi:hypothetical protein